MGFKKITLYKVFSLLLKHFQLYELFFIFEDIPNAIFCQI